MECRRGALSSYSPGQDENTKAGSGQERIALVHGKQERPEPCRPLLLPGFRSGEHKVTVNAGHYGFAHYGISVPAETLYP